MTLQDFFNLVQSKPLLIPLYFGIIFLVTLLANYFSKQDVKFHEPWKYVYAVIIYMVCIPGIFAVTLSIYFFLFEKRSIMQTDLLIQVLPIIAMIGTILLIKRAVNLNLVPGFDRISGLMTIIAIVLSLLWIIDRTHILLISFIPFYYLIIFIVASILLMRYAFRKLSS